jgi:hypothetical protein
MSSETLRMPVHIHIDIDIDIDIDDIHIQTISV